jgi:hypothetical protein
MEWKALLFLKLRDSEIGYNRQQHVEPSVYKCWEQSQVLMFIIIWRVYIQHRFYSIFAKSHRFDGGSVKLMLMEAVK